MKKCDLIKKVENMKFGDSFDVESLGDSHMFTMITKTRWFDNYAYILGGADNYTMKIINIPHIADEFEDVSEEVVNALYEMFKHDDAVQYNITLTSHITVEADHGALMDRKVNNFIFHR